MTTLARPTQPRSLRVCDLSRRALLIWPRLDARSLSRCGCDADRIARLVARRTSLPIEVITAILVRPDRAEPPFYFG
jgi:hypothetical protein